MSLAQIQSFSADLTIYTYSSVTAGLEDGGNVGIVTTGDPEELDIIDILKAPGRNFTSSYLEEKAALEKALAWLLENGNDPARVALICTDSQRLCTALLGQNLQKFSVILEKVGTYSINYPSAVDTRQRSCRSTRQGTRRK